MHDICINLWCVLCIEAINPNLDEEAGDERKKRKVKYNITPVREAARALHEYYKDKQKWRSFSKNKRLAKKLINHNLLCL